MAPIQIQIMSDLHLEAPEAYDVFEVQAKAPILALLGDIGEARHRGWSQFLRRQTEHFQVVLLVLGNHEPYGSDWTQAREQTRQINEPEDGSAARGTLVLLDRTRFDLSDDLTVLGCTLHSRIDPQHEEQVSFGLNDFFHVGDWTVAHHQQAHERDRAWLNAEVEALARDALHRRIVILTHHAPCIREQTTDPRHATSPIASGFATDLTAEPCWTRSNVRLWAFGHTHFNCDFVDRETTKRVYSNQRGCYFAQAAGFQMEKVVEI